MLDKSEKSLSGSKSFSVERRLCWGFLFGSSRISSRSGDEARLPGRGGRSSGSSNSCLEWIMGWIIVSKLLGSLTDSGDEVRLLGRVGRSSVSSNGYSGKLFFQS